MTAPFSRAGGILGLAQEVTFGTAVTPSTHWLPVVKSTLDFTQDIKPAPHLMPTGAAGLGHTNQRDFARLAKDVGGDIEFVPHYAHKSTALMLAYMMGAVPATTGAGPYVHTYTLADPGTLVGLTVQEVIGTHPTVSEVARVYTGVMPVSWDLSTKSRDWLMAKVKCLGKDVAEPSATSGTIAFVDNEEIQASHGAATGITFNSVAYFATDLTFTREKNLVKTPFIGSLTTGQLALGGFSAIRVKAKVYALTNTLLTAYTALTQADIVATFSGTGNNRLVITGQNAVLTKCSRLLDGPSYAMYDCEWLCLGSATKYGLELELRNDNAAAIS